MPLTIVFVFVAGISGMSFLHLNFLEWRAVFNEVANHGAFYLATAGLERTRSTLKIPDSLNWTAALDGSDPNYLTDLAPDPRLCPFVDPDPSISRGCVIPPFQTVAGNPTVITTDGESVKAPDFPIPNLFPGAPANAVVYSARAFNDEPGLTDTNQQLTFRALGHVHGEEKILEVTTTAISGLGLINCEEGVAPACPEIKGGKPQQIYEEGREPRTLPQLPYLDPPLTDPNNYYRQASNFGLTECVAPDPLNLDVLDGCFYYVTGDVTITAGGNNAVIVSTGSILAPGSVTLTNTILVGGTGVQLQGNALLSAPTAPNPYQYPAIISGGVVKGDASSVIYGTVYSTETIGEQGKSLNPMQVHGMLIADRVLLKATATLITDDHETMGLHYYKFMPGFKYPDGTKAMSPIAGSWREIE